MIRKTILVYSKAFKGLSLNNWLLSFVMLVNRSGSMVIPFFSIYATRQLHFSIAESSLILTVFGIGSVCGGYLGGWLTDKKDFYLVQLSALTIGGILFFCLGQFHTFWPVCCCIFLLSTCNDSFRPANSTAAAYYSNPENKTRSLSLNRMANNVGFAVGGAVGGLLASLNFHLLFWVDGGSNLLAAFLLIVLLKRPVTSPLDGNAKPEKKASAFSDGVYLLFIGLCVIFVVCFFQTIFLQPVFFRESWNFREDVIGMLFALNGMIIVAVEMILVHFLEGKQNPFVYIITGISLFGVSFFLLNILPHTIWVATVCIFLISFGEMFTMPFLNTFWLNRANDSNRGSYAGLFSMSWAAGQTIAPLMGGQLASYWGFRILWNVTGYLCFAAAGGFFVLSYIIKQMVPQQKAKSRAG